MPNKHKSLLSSKRVSARIKPPRAMSRWISLILKIAVSLGIFASLALKVDIGEVRALLAMISYRTVALTLSLILFQSIVTAYRWRVVMAGTGINLALWPATQSLFVSLALNQCFPSYVGGDAYRIYWLRSRGHPLLETVQGVLIDRVSALVALVAMLAIGLPFLQARILDQAVLVGLLLVFLAGVAGSITFLAADIIPMHWQRNRILAGIAGLATKARQLLFHGRAALLVGPLAVLVHFITAAILYLFARDLSVPLSLIDCVLLTPVIMLVTAIPISIAGWGVREGVMIGALSLVGVQTEPALTLALLLGVLNLANGLVGLLPLLLNWDTVSASRTLSTATSIK